MAECKIVRLYISAGHIYFGRHGQPPGEAPALETPRVQCRAGRGICGDRFFDFKENYKGQITFFAEETYLDLCRELGVWTKAPSVFRRNVFTRGLDLNALAQREFELQGVSFFGVEECKPCYWMDQAFGAGAERALQGRGGLRARILTDGWLQVS